MSTGNNTPTPNPYQEIINHAYSRGGADFYQMLMDMPPEYLNDDAKMSITTAFTKAWVPGAAAAIESIKTN